MKSNHLIASALLSALSLGVSASALAAGEDHKGDEKCAGIIKAGKNDCATSMNACHGHVEVDRHPEAWIWVPKGTCDKISGAHITSVVSPDE